jgi:hypothetical protein
MPANLITPAGNTTFEVRFTPFAAGIRTAIINIANNDLNENPYDFAIQGTGIAVPEINLQGNGVNIVDGDTTSSLTDHTDFGSVMLGANFTRVFTIQNVGTANLNLTGNPIVSITGNNASDFTVLAQPATPVAPAGNTTFIVRFTPSALGLRSVTITIANNDSDENPYDFAIQGTGIGFPEITVLGNNHIISDGQTAINDSDGTNIGTVSLGGSISRTFIIQNTGNAALLLTGNPVVSIAGTNSSEFSITQNPATTITPGGSTTFVITFKPTGSAGHRTAAVFISNNDSDENPYDFSIQGNANNSDNPLKPLRKKDKDCGATGIEMVLLLAIYFFVRQQRRP